MDDIRINKFLIKTNTIKSIFSFFYIFNKQICENIIKKYSKKEYNDFQIKENNDLVLVSKNESCSDKILQDILENIKRIKIDGNDHNINVQNHTNFSGNFTKDIYKEITSSSKKVKNNQIRNLEVISNKNLNRNYFKNLNYFQEKKIYQGLKNEKFTSKSTNNHILNITSKIENEKFDEKFEIFFLNKKTIFNEKTLNNALNFNFYKFRENLYKNIQNNSHFSNSNKNAISKKFLDKNYKKNFEFNLNFRSEPNFLDNYQKIEYLIKGAHSKEKLSKREDFDFLYNKNKKRNIYESVLNKNLKKKDSVKIIKIKEEQILINNEKKIIKKKPGLNSVFEKKDIFIFESSYNFIDKIYENIYLKKIQKNKKFSKKDKILLFNILYKSIEKSEILNHDFFYSSKKKINKIGEKSIKNELIFENLRSKNKITSEENAYVFKIFNKKFKIFKFKDKNLFGSKNLISKANYFYSKKYEEDLNYEKNKTFDNSNEIIFKKNHYEKNKKRNKTKFENIFLKNKNKELKEERKYILKFLESKISVTKLKDKNLFINTKNLIDESNIVYLKKRNDRITHKENSFIGSGSKKIVNIKKIKFVDNLIKSRIENNSEKNKRTLEYELDYKNISPNKIIYKKSNDIENILSKIKKIENENKKIRDDNENDRKSIDKLKFNYFKLVENKSKSKEDFATKKEVEKIVRSCIQGINFKSIVDFATEKLEKGLTIEKYRNGIL